MRYVITENQQEKVIQSLIDNSFNRRRVEINRLWGDMTEEEQEGHFSYYQSLNQIEKLKIDELQTDNGEWTVYLDAYMKSTWNPMDDSYDFDDLFDALGDDLSKFLGVEVFVPLNRKIDYKEGITEMIKLDIKVGDTLTGKGSVKLVHNDSFNGNDITI